MWKLLHALLGRDYVLATNSAAMYVCRVKVAPTGQRYFQPYSFQINMLDGPVDMKGEIVNGWTVLPLTPGAVKLAEAPSTVYQPRACALVTKEL